MPATARDRRISIRIASDTAAWLEHRGGGNKAGFVRQLIEREQVREQAAELLAVARLRDSSHDLEIINAHAVELNLEAEDVLSYQVIP